MGLVANPQFRNRFNLQTYLLNPQLLKKFCELTVANELEIAMANADFVSKHGSGLFKLFSNMKPLLSPEANSAVSRVLG